MATPSKPASNHPAVPTGDNDTDKKDDYINVWTLPSVRKTLTRIKEEVDPYMLRSECFEKALINSVQNNTLQTILPIHDHNEKLVTYLIPGDNRTFQQFLKILEENKDNGIDEAFHKDLSEAALAYVDRLSFGKHIVYMYLP